MSETRWAESGGCQREKFFSSLKTFDRTGSRKLKKSLLECNLAISESSFQPKGKALPGKHPENTVMCWLKGTTNWLEKLTNCY